MLDTIEINIIMHTKMSQNYSHNNLIWDIISCHRKQNVRRKQH